MEDEGQQKQVQRAAAAWRIQQRGEFRQENVVREHHSSAHDAGMRKFRSKVKEFISDLFGSQTDAATQLEITKTGLNAWLNGVKTHRPKDKEITEVLVTQLSPLSESLKQAAEEAGLMPHSAAAVEERCEHAAAAYVAPNLDHQPVDRAEAQLKPAGPDVYSISDDEPMELQVSASGGLAGSPLEHTSGEAASASDLLLTAAQQHAACPPSARSDVEGSQDLSFLLCVLCKLKKPSASFSKAQLKKARKEAKLKEAIVRRCMECTGQTDPLSTAVTCDRNSSYLQQQPERQQHSHWSSNADRHQQLEQHPECRKLFVGGLWPAPNLWGLLKHYFSKFGLVQKILIMTDQYTGTIFTRYFTHALLLQSHVLVYVVLQLSVSDVLV